MIVKAARAIMSIAWKHSFAQGSLFFFSKLLAQIQMIYITKNLDTYLVLVIDSKSLSFLIPQFLKIYANHTGSLRQDFWKIIWFWSYDIFFNSTLLQNKDLLVGVKVIVNERELFMRIKRCILSGIGQIGPPSPYVRPI